MRIRDSIISLLILLIYLSVSFPSSAKLVINEFSSSTTDDWVEVYNSGPDTVDLALYRLRDSTESNKLDLTGTIQPNTFLFFDWYNKLNKSGDVIKLVSISDESILDQVGYGDGENALLAAPSEGQTGGRSSDGEDQWQVLQSESKGGSNNQSSAAQIPTPTPSASPTNPTQLPTSIKTPIPNKSGQTPTRTPTPIKVVPSSSKAFLTPSQGYTVLAAKTTNTKERKDYPTPLLQETTSIPKPSQKATAYPSPATEVLGVRQTLLPIFVGVSVLTFGCAILLFLRRKQVGQ